MNELKPGDLVFIGFKTPKEIGIVSKHNLSFTRLNPKEIERRQIEGSVSRIWKDLKLKLLLIEISTFSSPDMPGTLRKMTFLEDELNEIRKLND